MCEGSKEPQRGLVVRNVDIQCLWNEVNKTTDGDKDTNDENEQLKNRHWVTIRATIQIGTIVRIPPRIHNPA